MGYESSGSGLFTVRPGIFWADAIDALKEAGVDSQQDHDFVRIRFSGAIYHLEKELEVVRKYFNGEFEVSGDEPKDVWKLGFQDGKIYKRTSKILWSEPEEIERLDKIWK